MSATIKNNTVSDPGTNAFAGLRVTSGSGIGNSDHLCATIGGISNDNVLEGSEPF